MTRYGSLSFEMVDHIHQVLKCKQVHRIDICAKIEKSKMLSIASKAIPAVILKHRLVADYIAWRFSQL